MAIKKQKETITINGKEMTKEEYKKFLYIQNLYSCQGCPKRKECEK